jgi:hypothetical protein
MHQPQYLAVKRVTIKAMLLYLFIRILHHASLGSRDVLAGQLTQGEPLVGRSRAPGCLLNSIKRLLTEYIQDM